MNFFQHNRLIQTLHVNTSYFIAEIKDEKGRLIKYKFLGQTPILKSDKYYNLFEEFRRSGQYAAKTIVELWL
jgi:hypothetical protein